MNLCGTNIVPIFITIISCGLIFVYFNTRLAEIKLSVEKQNRVLTAFITNVQSDLRGGCGECPIPSANHLASPEALKYCSQPTPTGQEKIVVSDDEDDSDDDSDDSDGDSGDDSGDEDDAPRKPLVVEGSSQSQDITLDVMSFSFEVLPSMSGGMSPIKNESTSSISEITEEVLNLVSLDETEKKDSSEEVNYETMRVDDLRKIVSDKNLSTKEEVKKLKKPELILLLKK